MTNNQASNEKSAANKLVDLVLSEFELIHSHQNEGYAITSTGPVRQVFNLDSKSFYDYVASRYYHAYKSALPDIAFKSSLSALSGRALFDGVQREIFNRVAMVGDSYWLDLCNPRWEAIQIDGSGWRVRSDSGVPLFERSSSMKEIPIPVGGGTLDPLWDLVNVPANDRLLVLAWLMECLRSDTPHVVLELVGEQGSAKSTTQRLLKMLIDPSAANLRSSPKKVEDIWIGAYNSHIVSFENISYLSQDYQDALCVLATGGTFATRTLYKNKEESIMQLCRPIVLNGITVNVTSQDLLDRCLHIELPRVQKRLQVKDIDSSFEMLHSELLGAFLDSFVNVLRVLPSVTIADDDRPRMLDFAHLGEAVFVCHGLPSGEFLSRYNAMRKKGVYRTIESSAIGQAILAFIELQAGHWDGRLKELLPLLERHRLNGEKHWPQSPKALGDALRRLLPALRLLGFDCQPNEKVGGTIVWRIRPITNKLANPCPASPTSPVPALDNLGHSGHSGHAGLELHDFDDVPTEYEIPF